MPILRYLVTPLLVLFFSLLSCSSDSVYPYTVVKGDPYNTRLYMLPGGIKLYIAHKAVRPRVKAALHLPSVAGDTLATLYHPSVYSYEYPLLFARIGCEVSRVADCQGSSVVYNNIPSNELENWAVIMRGTFTSLPDSLSIFLSGDVEYDAAVAIIMRSFSDFPLFSSAPRTEDANSLLANIRAQFSHQGKRLVTPVASRHDAKNRIELLPSPPAKVVFPDVDKLKIKSASGGPVMVVGESDDTLFTLTVRTPMKNLPASFLVLVEEYFTASCNDSVARVRVDKESRSIEFSLSGRVENMQHSLPEALTMLKAAADGEKFHKYLLANSAAVEASKNNYENIAMQTAVYAVGGERLCGLRQMAEYSMNALFTPSGRLFFCGKDADKAHSLFLKFLNPSVVPSLDDYSASSDTLARYLLLPSDTENRVTVTLGEAYEGVVDFATIALFNKAVTLSGASARLYCNGALLSTDTLVPFTRTAFDAAKSFLLYECSTHGSDAASLIHEYQLTIERGFASSQLYDALMHLCFSDVEEFYSRHNENAVTRLIISRESSLNMPELTAVGRVVHLTSDELYGY